MQSFYWSYTTWVTTVLLPPPSRPYMHTHYIQLGNSSRTVCNRLNFSNFYQWRSAAFDDFDDSRKYFCEFPGVLIFSCSERFIFILATYCSPPPSFEPFHLRLRPFWSYRNWTLIREWEGCSKILFTCGKNAAGNSQWAPCCGYRDSGSHHSVPARLTTTQQRTVTPERTRRAEQALGLPSLRGNNARVIMLNWNVTKMDNPKTRHHTGNEAQRIFGGKCSVHLF